MKENFQIHIWLGLLLCLLGMSCSDDTPAKGDDPGNGNTELEVNEWIESVMRSAQFKQKQLKVKMREMNCKWLRMSNIS